MLVTINSVNVTKAPKGYSVAEVSYLRDGKSENRKVFSFVDGGNVFNALTKLTEFPANVNVVLAKEKGKDGNEYWQWKGVEVTTANGNIANESAPKATTGKVLGSNYETPSERALRQVYIVRQSSISNAIELAKARNPKGGPITMEEILSDAKVFELNVLTTAGNGEPE